MSEMVSARCPHCDQKLKVVSRLTGLTIRCPVPACRQPIRIPEPDVSGAESLASQSDLSSLPHEHDLDMPVGAGDLKRKLRIKLLWITLGVIVFSLGMPATMAFYHHEKITSTYLLATGVLLASLMFLPFTVWWIDGRVIRKLALLQQKGQHLVHWTYTPDEWQAFEPDWKPGTPVGESYIGLYNGYCGGVFVQWNIAGAALGKITLVPGKPVEMRFTILLYGGYTDTLQLFRVPVPHGKVPEARHVIRSLKVVHRKTFGRNWKLISIASFVVFILSVIVFFLGFLK